jgi:hypothetical protein
MTWIETVLTQIEANLRLLIEGDVTRDGFPRQLHQHLQHELMHAMKTGMIQRASGPTAATHETIAPDQYILILPAIEAQILLTHPAELDGLTRWLEIIAARAGQVFNSSPVLRVVGDPHTTEARIQAGFSQAEAGDSRTYHLQKASDMEQQVDGVRLPNAFLIVNGLTTFPITTPIVNIGRASSNQLRLDDPHISPIHAQLRFMQGKFIIFDLDSGRGTFVNGIAISRHTLKTGDVIELCGIPLVYGQEAFNSATQTQELPVNPPPPEVL